jgi:hypothetical protein
MGKVLGSFQSALDEHLVDYHLRGDVREFTSLPHLHLYSHGLEVGLHSIHTDRNALDSENDFERFASTE